MTQEAAHDTVLPPAHDDDNPATPWRWDGSHASSTDLSQVAPYRVLGELRLQHTTLDSFAALAPLRHVQILRLVLHPCPLSTRLKSNACYRSAIISLLPAVWILDDVYISMSERRAAQSWAEHSPLAQEWEIHRIVTASRHQYSPGTRMAPRGHVVTERFSDEPVVSAAADARRLRFLAQEYEADHTGDDPLHRKVLATMSTATLVSLAQCLAASHILGGSAEDWEPRIMRTVLPAGGQEEGERGRGYRDMVLSYAAAPIYVQQALIQIIRDIVLPNTFQLPTTVEDVGPEYDSFSISTGENGYEKDSSPEEHRSGSDLSHHHRHSSSASPPSTPITLTPQPIPSPGSPLLSPRSTGSPKGPRIPREGERVMFQGCWTIVSHIRRNDVEYPISHYGDASPTDDSSEVLVGLRGIRPGAPDEHIYVRSRDMLWDPRTPAGWRILPSGIDEGGKKGSERERDIPTKRASYRSQNTVDGITKDAPPHQLIPIYLYSAESYLNRAFLVAGENTVAEEERRGVRWTRVDQTVAFQVHGSHQEYVAFQEPDDHPQEAFDTEDFFLTSIPTTQESDPRPTHRGDHEKRMTHSRAKRRPEDDDNASIGSVITTPSTEGIIRPERDTPPDGHAVWHVVPSKNAAVIPNPLTAQHSFVEQYHRYWEQRQQVLDGIHYRQRRPRQHHKRKKTDSPDKGSEDGVFSSPRKPSSPVICKSIS
eukprot:gb/GECH01005255.1/.p1 GENE.gb/GECH01005255.1/~~gb/GECH01005255.1/.p1  ORF type:complete len:709 (+),score=96.74 gb/GECH01005255.1/:1-2127(+)